MSDLIRRDDALLPCPFCGGEAEMSEYLVSCWGCLCVVPNGRGHEGESFDYDTKEEAIAAWNTRALPAIDPAAIREAALQAKLTKALEALQFASAELLVIGVMGLHPTALTAADIARAVLAELEVKK